MRKLIACAAVLLGLSACTETHIVRYVCPAFLSYSRAEQATMMEEARAIQHEYPTIYGAFEDYINLRDAIRICQKKAAEETKKRAT